MVLTSYRSSFSFLSCSHTLFLSLANFFFWWSLKGLRLYSATQIGSIAISSGSELVSVAGSKLGGESLGFSLFKKQDSFLQELESLLVDVAELEGGLESIEDEGPVDEVLFWLFIHSKLRFDVVIQEKPSDYRH